MSRSQSRRQDSSVLALKGVTAGLTGLLNIPVRMAITLANTHILGPAAYGLVHVALMIINVTRQLLGLGAPKGLVRFAARHQARDETAKTRFLVRRTAAILLIEGLVAMAALNLLAEPLAGMFHKRGLTGIITILSPLVPLGLLGAVAMSSLQGMQHIRTRAILEDLVVPPVVLCCLIAVLLGGWGLPGVLAVQLTGGALGVALGWIYLRRLLGLKPVEKVPMGEFWRFSLPLAGNSLVAQTIRRLDILIAALFLPAAQVGVYALATRLAPLVGLAQERFNRAFGPRAVQILEEERSEDVGSLMAASARWALVWAGLLALLFILAGAEIGGLFGRGFAGSAAALGILAVGRLISSACGPSGSLLTMSGHSGWTLFSTLFFLSIQISLAVTLIPWLGVKGAALATASALVATNLLRLFIAWRLVGAHPVRWRLTGLFGLFFLIASAGLFFESTGGFHLVIAGAAAATWVIIGWFAGLTVLERKRALSWMRGAWRKRY